MNVILFGPPGAGKGTQAKIIEEKHGLRHMSTGDMLRLEICRETDIGRRVKSIMEDGRLVPDEIVIEMIAGRIDRGECQNGALFDGFPRTVAQGQALDKMLAERDLKIDYIIVMTVGDDVIVERIRKRAKEENRSDDTVATLEKRLAQYRAYSAEVLPFYRLRKQFFEIDGNRPVADVTREIENILGHK